MKNGDFLDLPAVRSKGIMKAKKEILIFRKYSEITDVWSKENLAGV